MWCFLNRAMHLISPQNQLGQTVHPIQLSDNSGYLLGATSLVRPQSLEHLTLTKAASRNPPIVPLTTCCVITSLFRLPNANFVFVSHFSLKQLFFHSLFQWNSSHTCFLFFLALTMLISSDLILYYIDRQCWLRLYCRGLMSCQSQDRINQKMSAYNSDKC